MLQTILFVLAGVLLILYIVRRRARLKRDQLD